MTQPLPLPEDLMHLIEKRGKTDRRQNDGSEEDAQIPPEGDRRQGMDRRDLQRPADQ